SQPGNTVLPVGTNFTFQVSATGPNLRYQWKFSGENLPGQTNSTLTFSNIQLGGGGAFNVLVYNGGGYALGTNFLVRVGMAITAQPQNLLVPVGTSNSFAVQALSETPIRYQWYFNGTLIASTNNPTATDATLTLTNVQDTQEGSYFCVLRDDFDVITSNPASLRVALKPAITRQPVSVTTVEGGSATFTIAASNAAPMSFRWRTNSFPFTKAIIINGPTNSSITFTN